MGVCQTKVKKTTENPKKKLNNKIERVQTEFTATQETGSKNPGLLQLNSYNVINSPQSSGYVIPRNQQTKTGQVKLSGFTQNTPQTGQISILEMNASKKYSIIKKRYLDDQKSILSNNKTGIIVEMETYLKEDKESSEYVLWISKAQLDHPNLNRILEIYQDQNSYQVIYEFFDGKSLSELVSEDNRLPVVQINQIMTQIISIVSYLHSLNLVHGNLTLDSFQFKRNQNEISIKLIDLKRVKIKEPESLNLLNFTSPECLAHFTNYTTARDVWAIGVICYSLAQGHLPYTIPPNTDQISAIQLIKQTEIHFQDNDQPIAQFIQKMLVHNLKNRATLNQLKQDEFLKQNNQKQLLSQEILLKNTQFAKPCCFLQEIILGYFLQEFNWEQYLQIQKLFSEGDSDMDGYLSKQELSNLYKQYLNVTNPEELVEQVFQNYGINKEEGVSIQQFQCLTASRDILLTDSNIEIGFQIFSNGRKEINLRGLKKHLNSDSEQLVDEFNRMTNEEKILNLKQFHKLIQLII
ncbi:unnamed protein product (macronuclear) [Paramecium tetraurelia]|uniref:Protein kinase domain-containing protein n=1 Tax=Paramecium tetraurelia TaxID=5888 RepID=A0CG35_PARTE|nr:uncharacterized protein GSPATT00038196001 [Paramecium tetraurelia]CAK69752.1 unnamed protein product [Paramecium tetraurelia]|eukprot:XP_001437149.1 hypothetical protein (macronuclear) [Paramecium tetraurelia strain d4-2]